MGTVYLAEDPKLRRRLAIKVVRTGRGDSEVLARFEREAEISAKLHHPNIITIFDVGEEPDAGPFLAMEYVEGESLARRLKHGPAMTPAEAVDLLLQAKQALDVAHRAGIVHRDLKPENFMLAKTGQLKLMDFGIAKGTGATLTRTTDFLGTPAYAAPELLRGGQANQDSDRWSFAVTAFEMLSGRLPFGGDSVGTIVFRIVHEPIQRPADMSDALWTVFERALAKDPASRPPDLKGFMTDLIAALDLPEDARNAAESQLEGTLGHSGSWTVAQPPAERQWKWLALGATVLLALFAGVYVWQRVGPTRKLSVTSTPEGAEVFLDGTPLGRTPIRELVVKGNPRKLRLEKEDFHPMEHNLGSKETEIELKLLPTPFKVAIHSEPEGAEAFLDGAFCGLTPLPDLVVSGEGSHALELRQAGYQRWSQIFSRKETFPNPIRLRKADEPNPESTAVGRKPDTKRVSKRKNKKEKEEKKEEPTEVRQFLRSLFKKG